MNPSFTEIDLKNEDDWVGYAMRTQKPTSQPKIQIKPGVISTPPSSF